ncbi:unnamed protein product [Schistocephalus solidus]|uniref:Transposase n=1 Tax=Schistocephalus solidus TaxID=70667 RepID=A0A183SYZ7_SCHSO|nr:unnamed protein product [Schistocephalus solidus]
MDYVLVRRYDHQDVRVTILGVDGWTDPCLILSKRRLSLQPRGRPQGKRPPDKLNSVLLNVPAHNLHFGNKLAKRLTNLPVADEDVSGENR